MTTPYLLNSGVRSPYGLGWSIQRVNNLIAHWHYGWGDSYSALIIRVPEKKSSFILLANSSGASAPFMLQYGNVLNSPFALAFFQLLMPETASPNQLPPSLNLDTDIPQSFVNENVFSQAILRQYVETSFGALPGQAKRLLQYLAKYDSHRFQQPDWSIIGAVSASGDKDLMPEMATLSKAYRESSQFHPDVSLAIAEYYKKVGDQEKSAVWWREIGDRMGYGEETSTRQACVELGTILLKQGRVNEGRSYLWKAAQYGRVTEPSAYQQDIVLKMHSATNGSPA